MHAPGLYADERATRITEQGLDFQSAYLLTLYSQGRSICTISYRGPTPSVHITISQQPEQSHKVQSVAWPRPTASSLWSRSGHLCVPGRGSGVKVRGQRRVP
jgi:hypothetical protein